MTDPVLLEQRGRTLVITINRPEVRNAINRAASEAIATAIDTLDSSSDLTAAVITGAGGNFCTGMDLKAYLQGEKVAVPGRGLGFTHRPPAKPIIAAVEGYAVAGGTELSLACDMIVASRSANFGVPEVKRGLAAAGGGLFRLPKRIPYQVAMELALTGDNLTAERAHVLGLVNHLTDDGEALNTALTLADKIARNAPLAVERTKQVIVKSVLWPDEEAFELQREILAPVSTSEDAKEGARAFAEKREPQWKGR